MRGYRRRGGCPGRAVRAESERPVSSRYDRCQGCPYPAHGFVCWGGEDECLRTRVREIRGKENANGR